MQSRLKWTFTLLIVAGTTAAGTGVILSRDKPEVPGSEGDTAADLSAVVKGLTNEDPDGDPLPPGAIMRLGSARFRHGDQILAVAYSHNGQTLTTVGQSGLIRTWKAAIGQSVSTSHLPGGVPAGISADGKLAATIEPAATKRSPFRIQIVIRRLPDASIARTLEVPDRADLRVIALSRDGKRAAAAGGSDFLLVWDVSTGILLRRLPAPGWEVQGSQLQVAFSPDSKLLAGFDSHPTLRQWDLETGEERHPFSTEGSRISAFAFSGDGRFLACGDLAARISLWDTRSGGLIRSFQFHRNDVSAKRVEPSVPNNRFGPHSGFIPPKREEPMRLIDGVTSLAISHDGKLLACGCDGALGLWDAASGQERVQLLPVAKYGSRVVAMAFSPDDRFLVGGDSSLQIKLWETATGRRILAGAEPDLDSQYDHCCFAAISPEGKTAATFRSGSIRLWDVSTGENIGAISAGNVGGQYAKPITFSADGKYLLMPYHKVRTASMLFEKADRKAKWTEFPLPRSPEVMIGMRGGYAGWYNDFRLVRQVSKGSSPPVAKGVSVRRPMALSPDLKTVGWETGLVNGPTIAVSDWKSGETACLVSCPGPCRSASFSPDGRTIAVTGESYVGLWKTDSGNKVWDLNDVSPNRWKGMREPRPTAFSPDGRLLAVGDVNCSIRLLDVATGHISSTLKGHVGQILSLAFSDDGRRLISGSADTTALIWDVPRIASENDR
jgi:WD40 repeat protein